MKKLIAIFLILVMVLPMCLESQAEGTNTAVKPFYMTNWHDAVDYDYVYGAVTIRFYEYVEGQAGATAYVSWRGETSKSIPKIAQIVKEEFDNRPEGARYIKILIAIDQITEPECMIYLDKGAQLYADWFEDFCKEYQGIGGKLDGVELDLEYNGVLASYIRKAYRGASTTTNEDGQTETLLADKEIYNKIVNHPSYATKVRPFLEERGFQFSAPNAEKSEIFGIYKLGSQNAEIWDAVMRNHLCAYLNEACAPIMKYFPEAYVSNYRFSSSKGWLESVGQKGERTFGGNTTYAGNTANEIFYVRRPLKQFFDTTEKFNKPVFYNGAVYADTPFNSFLYEINTFKDMYESSDTERLNAWVAGFSYKHTSAPENGTRETPYYSEAILHLGLLNISTFLGYIVDRDNTDVHGETYKYADNIRVFSDLLTELTRVVGTADRKTISVPTEWNSAFVLSGMYAGGRNVWRLTPNTLEGTTLESFKIKDSGPTFQINGQTITFPKGKIITDGKVSYIGTCGYWIETPADVTPIITNDADRYSRFPAFKENFDGYKTGMEYTYDNVEHVSSWQIKKTKSATLVVAEEKGNAGNKILSVTGDVTLKNVKVTENITAGDTYAENQAWEITATIPANMGADAKITLLAIYGDLEKPIDGGFQLSGGKLYYYNGDKYVELEGVDTSAGGKFILKREMDFNTAGAFTCDYVVYDAEGKELAKVKNIPVVKGVEVPVQTIGLSFSDVSGTVYLDDYKLYANGTAADFKLYDAKTGIQLTDMETARTASTAYRVSWMNATAYEKVYSIVAEYGTGETKVLKEIKMTPGTDAVETGIVEVAEGQSVRVYLRNDSVAEPDIDDGSSNQPDTDNDGNNNSNTDNGSGDKPDTPQPTTVPVALVAIIAGAVIVVVIVAVSKKKKATPAEEPKDNAAE